MRLPKKLQLRLERAIEKAILEHRLECARDRFADRKLRAELRLRGAEKFDVDSASFAKVCLDRFERERRRVAIPAEMPKHDALDLSC